MTGILRDDKVLKEAFELKKKKNETKMTKVKEDTQHHTASTDVCVCVFRPSDGVSVAAHNPKSRHNRLLSDSGELTTSSSVACLFLTFN